MSDWLEKIQVPITFTKARKRYMNLTKKCFTVRSINELHFDCIIVGSDEVWNFIESKANAKIKFGEGLSCQKLIAYAPSVGQTSVTELPNYAVNGIRRFAAISARDDITEEICQSIRNEKIKRVVDPTILVDIPTELVRDIRKPYILFYYCDGLSGLEKDKIFEYAKRNGLAVYGAGECDKCYTKKKKPQTFLNHNKRSQTHILCGL